MILAGALALSVIVALMRGGGLRRLAGLPLRWGWVALLAFGLQIYLIYFPEPKAEGLTTPRAAILIFSYVLILGVVWQNRSLPGIGLIGTGLAANFAAMILNGGYMPITAESLAQVGHSRNILGTGVGARVAGTKDIVLPRELTTAWWLTDIFVVPPPFPIPSVFSFGDLLIACGTFWLVQRGMCDPRDPKQEISMREKEA